MASSFFWRRATWNTGGPIVAVSASATAAAFWPQSNRLEPSLCDTSHTSSTGSSNAHTKFFPADKASLSHGSQIISLKHTDAPLSFSIAGTGTGGPLETKDDTAQLKEGMQPDLEGDFAGLFPLRQLWVPRLSYPLWDTNWDGRQQEATGDREKDHQMQRQIRKHGVTRHIILVRHGQYDETFKEDEKRILTPLGREQAHLTGKRIAEMMKGAEESFGPCHVRALRVSGLSRARETAAIIATHLPGIKVEEPDHLINEGRPCHTIPGGPVSKKEIELTDAHHPRIEEAYQKYFYRAPPPRIGSDSPDEETPCEKHEFEIIVCHANVIRYYLCRALQLPPEAWLRYCPFNCSLTYLTIRSTGTVSCRMVGDIGHLPYNASTFSGHHGYNW